MNNFKTINKLYISPTPHKISGFINVNPLAPAEGCFCRDPRNLEDLVAPNECSKIIVEEVTKLFPYHEVPQIVQYWISKLRIGGTLTIIDQDIRILVRHFIIDDVQLEQFNKTLFSSLENPENQITWTKNGSCLTLDYITELFKKFGLKIVSKSLDGIRFTIIGER